MAETKEEAIEVVVCELCGSKDLYEVYKHTFMCDICHCVTIKVIKKVKDKDRDKNKTKI